jgi:hypothetical protein
VNYYIRRYYYSDFLKAEISERIAAMAPKTIPTHLPVIKVLSKTQMPREQIAKLNNFMLK